MQHDLDDLRVVVAGGLDGADIVLADVAALARDFDGETYCGVCLGIVGARHYGWRQFRVVELREVLAEIGVSRQAIAAAIEFGDGERDAGEYSAPRGELVVTAPIVLGRLHVFPIVTEFLHAFADVDVRFVLTDGSLDLIGDHVDLAVRIGELPDSRLVAARVGQVRHVVCASPAYFAKHGVPAAPHDLQRASMRHVHGPVEWRSLDIS